MNLEVEEIRSMSRLAGQEEQWSDVLATSQEDRLFLKLPWLKAWWDVYGEDRGMLVLKVLEDGRAVGYAPLMVTSRGKVVRWKKLQFIGSGPSDRCGIIAKDGREDVHRAVWDYIQTKADWDVIELRDMMTGGPTDGAVRSAFPYAEIAHQPSPYIPLQCDYGTYVGNLSKNMRGNLSRYWRKLQEEGATFQAWRTKDDVQRGVKVLKELSDQRWDFSNVLKGPGMMSFVDRASRELAKEGSVVFHALTIKEEPVAITMGFEDDGRYMYYLSGFGPQQAKNSPGSILLSKIIEDCCTRGKREVDLLRGDEAYKYRFNARDREQAHMRTVNRGLLRSAGYALREAPLS
jgi:CelD/BcsL family acetyltransferase involved in cellulose biosynthesis